MRFHKILVAIDDSPLCPSIFTTGLELAQSSQATLLLVHCLNPERVSESTVPMMFEAGMALEIGEEYRTQQILIDKQMEEARVLLKRYCEEAISQGVSAEFGCRVGEAGDQLCETAREWEADLIVVGRRGRKGWAEAFLGSVSNYVVHHAPCSVLVIQDAKLDPMLQQNREIPHPQQTDFPSL